MTKGIRRMADPDIPYPPSAHPPDRAVETVDDLALWLGDSRTSWTGDFIRILAASDEPHHAPSKHGTPGTPRRVRAPARNSPVS